MEKCVQPAPGPGHAARGLGRRGLGLTSLTIRTRPRHDMLGLMLALFDPASAADTLEVLAAQLWSMQVCFESSGSP